MVLSSPWVAVSLRLLGETEAGFAGEQTAKGYPSRAVTQGRPAGLPRPFLSVVTVRLCLLNSRPKGGTNGPLAPSSMWPYFPEKSGHIFRNAQSRS